MNGVCLVTPILVVKLLLIKSLWITVGHHAEASRNEIFKGCTELCYTGSANETNDIWFLLYLPPVVQSA